MDSFSPRPAGCCQTPQVPSRFRQAGWGWSKWGEHWRRPSRSKHNGRQEINSLRGKSPPFPTPCLPRAPGANHIRHGHTHRRTLTPHACKHTSADTHAHSLRSTPVLPSTPLCRGGGQISAFCAQASALILLSPMKLLFFVVMNFPGRCVYLFPKLSPVTKSDLRHWNNQWRLLQSMAPCLPGTKINARNRNLITWKKSRNPSA